MIIPILSTLSCLGWVEWEWEELTDGITQIPRIICSWCVRDFVGFLMRSSFSSCDGYTRCKPLSYDSGADDSLQYVIQIQIVPPTLPQTAMRRQCVANSHSFTVQTQSIAITIIVPVGRTVEERSRCYDEASVRKMASSLVQDQHPKVRMCLSLTLSSSFKNTQPTPLNNPIPD